MSGYNKSLPVPVLQIEDFNVKLEKQREIKTKITRVENRYLHILLAKLSIMTSK